MSLYTDYLEQIKTRKDQGLHPKPIEEAELVSELINQIIDVNHQHREKSLDFFIYNVLPGTTSAAGVKAQFLKEIIIGSTVVEEITPAFAFELLSHMKGGPSVEVLWIWLWERTKTLRRARRRYLKHKIFMKQTLTDWKKPIKMVMQSQRSFSSYSKAGSYRATSGR